MPVGGRKRVVSNALGSQVLKYTNSRRDLRSRRLADQVAKPRKPPYVLRLSPYASIL